MEAIILSPEQHKCLREHLNAIESILGGSGLDRKLAKSKLPTPEPKETKAQKTNKYLHLIESGQRGTKPKHLRKT